MRRHRSNSVSDIFGDYMRSISRIPLLTQEEELHHGRLVRSWLDNEAPDAATKRRGQRAMQRMVTANLRLVVSVVSRHQHASRLRRLDPIDLVQAGNLGLIRAVERYDPARGYRFSTFAFWWIRQAVNRHIQEYSGAIRLPYALQVLSQRYQALQSSCERNLDLTELAERLGAQPERIQQVIRAVQCSRLLSLDQSLGDGDPQGLTLLDTVGGGDQPRAHEDYHWLHAQIGQLSPLEQEVLLARYSENAPSVASLAERMGRSRHQIQAIEKRALHRLRQVIEPMLNP